MSNAMILALILGYGLGAATFPFVAALAHRATKRLLRGGSRRRGGRRYHY